MRNILGLRGFKGLFLVTMVAFLCGCASANLKVSKPLAAQPSKVSLTILDKTAAHITEEDAGNFKSVFSTTLQKSGIQIVSTENKDVLSVVGEMQQYDPGNQALRYFIGFGAGTGNVESSWKVIDQTGLEVANCKIDGSISAGIFGGNFYGVHDEMAEALLSFLMGSKE